MSYSKSTDEMIRGLNRFVAKAKEAASEARGTGAKDKAFGETIANYTEYVAGNVEAALAQIADIAEHPDEITNRFTIMKAVEDAAFMTNLLAFNVGLGASRGQAEQKLGEQYLALANIIVGSAVQMEGFFGELAQLIFADMQKTAEEKIQAAIQTGNDAVEKMNGDANIAFEVGNVVRTLSETKPKDITVELLEGCLVRLNILAFAADIDAACKQSAKMGRSGILSFKAQVLEAISFFEILQKIEREAIAERGAEKPLRDLIFRMNVLLFYMRSEMPDSPEICEEMNSAIHSIRSADKVDYSAWADRLIAIEAEMLRVADGKKDGDAIRFIAVEVKNLLHSVREM